MSLSSSFLILLIFILWIRLKSVGVAKVVAYMDVHIFRSTSTSEPSIHVDKSIHSPATTFPSPRYFPSFSFTILLLLPWPNISLLQIFPLFLLFSAFHGPLAGQPNLSLFVCQLAMVTFSFSKTFPPFPSSYFISSAKQIFSFSKYSNAKLSYINLRWAVVG